MIKKFICKLFGHVHVEEMYAAPLAYQEHRYVVIKECNCARCGKNISFKMGEPMSRVQMLQEGWFFNPNPYVFRVLMRSTKQVIGGLQDD